jgi:hypothetical protein
MTQPFNPAGDGQPAVPAPDATAARSRAAGGTGRGVPLTIWPGLPAHNVRDGLPCGGPVTAAAARRVIDAFSLPGDLVAADGRAPAALPPPGDPAAGTAGLAIAGWRGPGCCGSRPGSADGEPAEDPGPMFAACERCCAPSSSCLHSLRCVTSVQVPIRAGLDNPTQN